MDKRLAVASVCGIGFGLVCFGFAASGPESLPGAVAWQIVLSRSLIGFGIGISRLRWHWTLNGGFIGILFSLPLAFSGLMAPESPEFSHGAMVTATLVMGLIYGLLTEVAATKLFKSPAVKSA